MSGDQDDIELICDLSATPESKFAVACRLETVVHEKLFELEEVVDDKTKKKFQAVCIGMGKRISTYRTRVKNAKKLTGGPASAPLIELSELREIERNNAPVTPKGNRSMRDYTVGA